MLDTILFFAHYSLILLFGVVLSFAFSGIKLSTRKNLLWICVLFAVCGGLQLAMYCLFDELTVWKVYPLITHLPILLLLCLYYRRRLITALSAVSTAYLCCQPAKWTGLLIAALMQSFIMEQAARIAVLLAVGFISLYYLAPYLSDLYGRDVRSVCIFGSVPMVNYLFDYTMGIYTGLWTENNRVAAEFLPFFLCVIFMVFCVVYYKEYEQKADAERKEQIIRISAQQQAGQIKEAKRSEQEIRLLRHDMRLFLSSLAVCIGNDELEKAQEMIAAYSSRVDGTKLERFCENDVVNYVLSDFAARFKDNRIPFACTVELCQLKADEVLFSSILSNTLDNALNAQEVLPFDRRSVKLMLKTVDGKLLLSVKNPIDKTPIFVDGLPVSGRSGHGYGTQSIRYITERLGGNYQFSAQDGWFIVRVVL